MLDLVWERYEEAVKGDLRMNCDSCVYRIALPGFEDKVGPPQQPRLPPGTTHHGTTTARPARRTHTLPCALRDMTCATTALRRGA
ncbi:hypothetical protein SALBM311S_09679 [Streptomyces alboniger]